MAREEFELIQEKEMREVGGTARLWKHKRSGAEVVSICNDDENKCFGVSFYTPPSDSSGVAHILEHSVLCGSEKYPLKEPFVELLKGSLQTFLNAFTFPDKTCYPVASANLQDFYNLIDVYMDAVFHPLLTENTFRQEGWHYDAQSTVEPWKYKGVVFNEMKGVYSQPESMLAEKSQQAVFPDNIYKLDSGGNPEVIPELTWEKFQDFHKRFYHPSNARFFFWGDDPEEKRLEIVNKAISSAQAKERAPIVPLQEAFSSPKYVTTFYPADADDNRALFTINWLLPERGNVYEALKMEMLEHILEGLPGSPLRRALIESGLGEDTVGCGLETDLRQMYYSTGLKGIQPEDVEKAEKIIFDTLDALAEDGIPEEVVESAINSVEFAYRENNSGRFPRGLAAMIQALSTWLYGGDPFAALAWEEFLEMIKKRLAAGEKIFEDAIRQYFIENPHRVKVVMLPDNELAAKRVSTEREKLKVARDKSTPKEQEEVVKISRQLEKAQLTPDDPADLAKIPVLTLADLPTKNRPIPSEIIKVSDFTFLDHDIRTNGILYANLLLPIRKIPERLLPLLPLFCRSLIEFGTKKNDYATLGLKIASRTGGLGAAPLSGVTIDKRTPFLYFAIQGKAVENRIGELFELLTEVLLDAQTSPDVIRERLVRMIPEERARLEYVLQSAGNAAVTSRIRSHFRPEQAFNERFMGISQLRFLRELEQTLLAEPEKVISDLSALREIVLSSGGAVLDLTGDRNLLEKGMQSGEVLLNNLPVSPKLQEGLEIATYQPFRDLPSAEAFITQGQVNFVGKGANLFDLGYEYDGSANVILRWLRMGPLWENVRVAGGAYGANCVLDRAGGTFVCSSFRDPNVERTLNVYDNLYRALRAFQGVLSQMSQAIIGAVGDLDTWLLPDAKGAKALGWYLSGESEEERQQMREEILATTAREFHEFADVLQEASRKGVICVVGGGTAADAAKELGWPMQKL